MCAARRRQVQAGRLLTLVGRVEQIAGAVELVDDLEYLFLLPFDRRIRQQQPADA